MKIAQIAPPWIAIPPQNYGGTENIIYHLVEELVTLGHDVTLLAPGDARTSAKHISFIPKALLNEGVPWQATLKAYYHLHKSLEYVAEHNFDIVHSHLSSSGDMYLFPLSATLPTPHVTTLHGHFPFDRAIDSWVGDADNYFMEWAQHVSLVAISENARMQVKQPAHFVGTVHHGIQTRDYAPTDAGTGNYFVWLGRFTLEKGAHLAIEAAKRAQVPLVLAGFKEMENRDAMQYYHHMIKPHIDGKQIRYIGPVNVRQKIELFSQARGLLHPVEWDEPFGIAMIEAMATGCPVIAFAHGAAPEIIIHGQTGFLAHTMQDMVQYIGSIDGINRKAVRGHIARHFSSRTMAENYLRVYTKVMAATACKDTIPARAATEPLIATTATNPTGILTV
jgi:glycosyltransferase involved in cell wall biosynthesis